MSRLASISSMVQKVAEAISSVLEVETVVVDDEYTIIAGTGKFKELVGTKDDEVYCDDDSYIYSRIFNTGQCFIIEDPNVEFYGPTLIGEIGEICCPIIYNDDIIGILALVAFDNNQKSKLLGKKSYLLSFLKHMANLLVSRISEKNSYDNLLLTTTQLKELIESIELGIISIDTGGKITNCNKTAEVLLGKTKDQLLNTDLKDVWPDSPLLKSLKTGRNFTNEEVYLETPKGQQHLLVTTKTIIVKGKIKGAMASFKTMEEARKLAFNLTDSYHDIGFDTIKGSSTKIRKAKNLAARVSRSNSTVLITGESGTGKELFARAIHYSSPRKDKPLVVINCGAIPESLLESELFGYEDGAFTGAKKGGRPGKFEIANGGTVFLDEIGDLPLHLQVKLLHVLQRRQLERVGGTKTISVDVRIIAATNKDLEKLCEEGNFRKDLYYRLNVIPLKIPPLRERREDIELLMNHFLKKYSSILGKTVYGFTEEVKQAFYDYNWPGNIRELENAVEYAVNIELGKFITTKSIPARIRSYRKSRGPRDISATLKERLENHESNILLNYYKKIKRGELTKTQVAKLLGISRTTLYRKLKELEKTS